MHRVRRLRSLADPVIDALQIDVDRAAFIAGTIRAEVFNRSAIATRTRLGNNHAIERLVHGTNLGETDFESHVGCFAERYFLGKAEHKTGPQSACQAPDRAALFDPLMLKAGIVGLPNVGKSTLFNALTRSRKAEAANYPFCTIDPNVGVVIVPDERLYVLQKIAKTERRHSRRD